MATQDFFPIPPVILERYNRLYDLVQNHSKDGRLEAKQVAEYLGMSVEWLRHCIQSGSLPFAFANSKAGRSASYIGILPFYAWETQRIFGRENEA